MWCSPWMCTPKWGMDLIFVLNQWTTSLWNQQPHYITGKKHMHISTHTHTHTSWVISNSCEGLPPTVLIHGIWVIIHAAAAAAVCLLYVISGRRGPGCVRMCMWVFISCNRGAAIDFQLQNEEMAVRGWTGGWWSGDHSALCVTCDRLCQRCHSVR